MVPSINLCKPIISTTNKYSNLFTHIKLTKLLQPRVTKNCRTETLHPTAYYNKRINSNLTLHPPNHDSTSIIRFRTVPNLFFPRTARATVEQDEVSFIDSTSTFIHVTDGLFQSLPDGLFDIAS